MFSMEQIPRRRLWRRAYLVSPRHRQLSPLQHSIRQAQRHDRLRSPRQWLMMVSGVTLVVLVVLFFGQGFAAASSGIWNNRSSNNVRPSLSQWTTSMTTKNNQDLAFHRSSRAVTKEMMSAVADVMDDDDDDDEASSKNHDKKHAPPNPTFYGWTPDAYPNPLLDPVRCAISGLIDDARPVLDPYNTNITMPRRRSDKGSSRHHKQRHHDQQPLFLCDPDWVLGGMVLEDLSTQLSNFSALYYAPAPAMAFAATSTMTHYAHAGHHYQQHITPHSPLQPSRRVRVALATVRKMNLAAVLRSGSYFSYEDENDMVNDAAQIFARSLFDAWFGGTNKQSSSSNAAKQVKHSHEGPDDSDDEDDDDDDDNQLPTSYVLIFLSIQDRVCFITTGMELGAVLPWWRLDHIVASMKPLLSQGDYGTAVVTGMEQLTLLLQAGPPTWNDRLHDFMTRFGVVIAFAIFTFLFGAWGEYRDRRKRWRYAEQRSKLSGLDRDKARQLQKEYHTRVCPICLECFDYGDMHPKEVNEYDDVFLPQVEGKLDDDEPAAEKCFKPPLKDGKVSLGMKRVDTFGIPLKGVDGKKIKLLRCGHLFCETCWSQWVHSGCGNPCNCPVCRQDVGRSPRKRRSLGDSEPDEAGDTARVPADQVAPIAGQHATHPTYGAVNQSRTAFGSLAAFTPSPRALLQSLRGNNTPNALDEASPLSGPAALERERTVADGCCSPALGGRMGL